jgi:thioredoxin 1
MNAPYEERQPERAEIDRLPGATILEFGSTWCGWCQAAEHLIEGALEGVDVRHLKVQDGSGRPLGRSFRVKLWPTLVFLKDGKEVARVVRPTTQDEVNDALRAIA